MNVVVTVGLAVGCANVASFKPLVGNHEYVLPETAALPIVVLVVLQFKFCVVPAFAVGIVVLTLTVTLEVAVQPLLPVTVTV